MKNDDTTGQQQKNETTQKEFLKTKTTNRVGQRSSIISISSCVFGYRRHHWTCRFQLELLFQSLIPEVYIDYI